VYEKRVEQKTTEQAIRQLQAVVQKLADKVENKSYGPARPGSYAAAAAAGLGLPYQAVVRSALSYGAALWHQPTGNKPKGLAAKLQKQQNQGLQAVLGAFKATPIRQLETESYVPPLDLWLNRRIARFQARIEHSGIAQKVRDACSTIRARILRRTNRRRQASAQPADTPGAKRRLWVEGWIRQPLEQWDWQEKKLVL
jgi:hypothetical protein